jgi:hypothetical protein
MLRAAALAAALITAARATNAEGSLVSVLGLTPFRVPVDGTTEAISLTCLPFLSSSLIFSYLLSSFRLSLPYFPINRM